MKEYISEDRFEYLYNLSNELVKMILIDKRGNLAKYEIKYLTELVKMKLDFQFEPIAEKKEPLLNQLYCRYLAMPEYFFENEICKNCILKPNFGGKK